MSRLPRKYGWEMFSGNRNGFWCRGRACHFRFPAIVRSEKYEMHYMHRWARLRRCVLRIYVYIYMWIHINTCVWYITKFNEDQRGQSVRKIYYQHNTIRLFPLKKINLLKFSRCKMGLNFVTYSTATHNSDVIYYAYLHLMYFWKILRSPCIYYSPILQIYECTHINVFYSL